MARNKSRQPTHRDQAQAQQDENRQTAVAQAEWRGPLPPPAALQGFEDIVPGAAERIMAEFEKEAEHRRALENKQARFVVRDTHIGQALAIIFALSAFAIVGYAIHENAPWVAAVIGAGVIAAGITAFLKSRSE